MGGSDIRGREWIQVAGGDKASPHRAAPAEEKDTDTCTGCIKRPANVENENKLSNFNIIKLKIQFYLYLLEEKHLSPRSSDAKQLHQACHETFRLISSHQSVTSVSSSM